MKSFPESLLNKLKKRQLSNALRNLSGVTSGVDFSSNDYLGFAKNEILFDEVHELLIQKGIKQNGATGSRLLSGNHALYQQTESYIASFHQVESALIFNSGYDANIGFFSSVPQRNDIVLYDEMCHASIRDGIQMGLAKSFKFKHNDVSDLENVLSRTITNSNPNAVYIVTESVFSMDGDTPDLKKLVEMSLKYKAYVVVDEAHALGVFGENGCGLVQQYGLQDHVFARIVTFGKALGIHGAAILGSKHLNQYLINFTRSFVYTTGLSPHAVASIYVAYQYLSKCEEERQRLFENINYFRNNVPLNLQNQSSFSPIQSIIISGNNQVKSTAEILQKNGIEVKPILSPTVPKGQERLRFCLHSYNTKQEILKVLNLLKNVTTDGTDEMDFHRK
ncbi:MAG: aminotransferase class I/II-fold pyridoxal phosphate-dependent enzyme [Flavobacterium sp.]